MLIKISDIKIKPGRRDAKPKGVEELAGASRLWGCSTPLSLPRTTL